jgi:hypothetical protein
MIVQVLKYIAAIATILTGLASLFWPTRVLGFTGLDVSGGRGITEIRTILGALFVGLGAAALFFNMPETYRMLGITYVVMAVVRTVSMIVDDSLVSSNIISVIAEAIFGIILLI